MGEDREVYRIIVVYCIDELGNVLGSTNTKGTWDT